MMQGNEARVAEMKGREEVLEGMDLDRLVASSSLCISDAHSNSRLWVSAEGKVWGEGARPRKRNATTARLVMQDRGPPKVSRKSQIASRKRRRTDRQQIDKQEHTYFSLVGAVLREVTEVECDWPWRSAWWCELPPPPVAEALSVGSDSRDRWATRAGETPWPPWLMDSEGR